MFDAPTVEFTQQTVSETLFDVTLNEEEAIEEGIEETLFDVNFVQETSTVEVGDF